MNTQPYPCVCGQTVVVKQVDKFNHVVTCPGCQASSGYRKDPTQAVQAWDRLMKPVPLALTPGQIDDMAFGYVPSGKIGELRDFAEAVLAAAADKLGNAKEARDAVLEHAAKACEARIKNPDPNTWGFGEEAAYDAEDMACAAAVRALKVAA